MLARSRLNLIPAIHTIHNPSDLSFFSEKDSLGRPYGILAPISLDVNVAKRYSTFVGGHPPKVCRTNTGMSDAFLAYLLAFGAGILGGLSVHLVASFGIRRGCRRLSLRVGDIEERLLSLRGKAAASARWQEDKFAQEALKEATVAGRRPGRFDNDPPEY